MTKNCYLRIRVTPEFLNAMQELADNDRRAVSDYARIILEDHVAQKGYKIPDEIRKYGKNNIKTEEP